MTKIASILFQTQSNPHIKCCKFEKLTKESALRISNANFICRV